MKGQKKLIISSWKLLPHGKGAWPVSVAVYADSLCLAQIDVLYIMDIFNHALFVIFIVRLSLSLSPDVILCG